MKKIFLFVLFLASAGLYSQELDEAYLASLPESVRGDVLNQIAEKEVQKLENNSRLRNKIRKTIDGLTHP